MENNTPQSGSQSGYDNSQYDSSLESTNPLAQQISPSTELSIKRPSLLNFNRKAIFITGGAVALVVLIGLGALFLGGGATTDKATTPSAASYAVAALPVTGVAKEQQLSVGNADHLSINGQLRVANTVVIAPTATPTSATAGQIYYDKTTNQPYYYNGSQFVSLAPTAIPAHVASIGGATGVVQVGNGLALIDGQLQLSPDALTAVNGAGVTSFQGQTGAVALTGGSGISINGTNIVNSGVINLTSAASGVTIAQDGNGNYTLSGNVIDGAGASGQIALFTGGSTVAGSILNQSGGTLTVGGSLAVTGAIKANSLSQTAAGQNISVNAGNDVITFTAGGRSYSFPTTGPSSQTICTTAISCAAGGGTAVVLNPATPQIDAGTNSSLAINNTGGGNLLQLQSNGADKFVVNNSGVITVGSIDYSQVLNRPTSLVNSVTGTANQVIVSSSTGNVTLSLPQDLAAVSSPSFTNLGLTGGLTVAGASSFNGTVAVTNNNNLTVGTGTTTLGGILNVSGVASLSNNLNVTGNTTLAGNLNVSGASSFSGLATFGNNLTQTGNGTFTTGNGAVTLNGNTTIAGANSLTTGSGTVTLGSLAAGLVQSSASGVLSSGAVDRNSATAFGGSLSVPNGGTGASSFAANGLLYGNNAGAVQATTAGSSGQLLLASALGVPTFTSLGGDATLDSSGSLTINKLQGATLAFSSLAAGQVVQYNGTNFVNGLITNSNLQAGSFTNITGTGALSSGSISGGFGAISTGNNITTTAAVQGATVTATGGLQGNSLNVSGFAVSNTGAITAVTGITSTGGYTQSGAATNSFSGATTFTANLSQTGTGSFSTGSGAVSLNGNTTISGSNSFSTGTGTVSLNGNTSVTGSNTFTVGNGGITDNGSLTVAGSSTFANNLAVQGGNITIGKTGVNGLLNLTNSSNTNLTALQSLAPTGTGTATIQIPGIAGGSSDQVCLLSLGNCAGAGAGVTHGTSSAGYVPVFTSGNNIVNSIAYQSGTSLGINTTTPGAYALNVQGGDVNFSGAATVGNGLNVTGATNLGGAVSVTGSNSFSVGTGATSLGGSLGVTGATNLAGAFTANSTSSFNGAVSLNGANTLTVASGATTLGGALSVSGTAGFAGNISQTGAVSFSTGTGAVSLNGDTTVNGKNFAQTGTGSFSTATGAVTLNGNTSVTGSNTFTTGTGGISDGGNLGVTGSATVAGGASITGTTSINTTGTASTTIGNASTPLTISSTGLKVTSAGATSGITTLAVSGAISAATSGNTINGIIINGGALSGVTAITSSGAYSQTGTSANSFSGATSFSATGTGLTVSNNATIGGTASIGTLSVGSGGISDSGALSVSGAGSFAGQLSLTAAGIGLNVTNNATIGGSLAIQGANALSVGTAGSNTGTVAFANSTNSYYGVLQAGAPDTTSTTGNANYVLPSIVAGTTDTVCLYSLGNCGAAANTVSTSSAGTVNQLAKFTAGNQIANSNISDDGTTVTVASALSATSVSTSTIQSVGNLSINPGGNLTIGATNRTLALQGNASSTIAVSASGYTTTLAFATPGVSNKTVTIPNETGTVCLQNSLSCGFATSGSGVTSVDGLTGAVTIGNTTTAGSVITINDASTTVKGIAQFNSTNFTASSGLVNTIQDIATSSSVQFANLNLTSNLTLGNSGVVTANNYTGTGSADITFDASSNAFVFKTANGANSFYFPTYGGQGQVICTSGITCATGGGTAVVLEPAAVQAISSNRTGIFINKTAGTGNVLELQAGGTDALVVNASGTTTATSLVAGTLSTNTITPTGPLTIGATSKSFTLQGTAGSTITTSDGGFATNIGFNIGTGASAPTGAVSYQFQNNASVAPGTYNVCTTAGNCAGVGGSVTTTGGTTGQLAKFTSYGNIADSIVSDNGTGLVTIGGNLNVGVAGSASLTLGVASSTNGNLIFKNSTNGNSITLVPSAPSANTTVTLPNASGTVAVSASGPITLDALTGQISCASCLTSGGAGGASGISAITGTRSGSTGATGSVTINNALTTGTSITLDDASTTQKGIAQFNAVNFSVASGNVNTVQDINTSASPTFANLALQGASGLTIGSGSNVGQLAFRDGTSTYKAAFSPVNLTADRSINIPDNSGTLVVAASGNLVESAAGVVSIVNNPSFTTSVTTPALLSSGALSITAGGQISIGDTTHTLSLIGSTSSTLAFTNSGKTTTINTTAPTANRSISFPDASGTVCLTTNNCNFASAGSGVTSLNGLTGALSVANASASGSVITINDATTTTKGIASFNATNFSVSAGAVNTVQDIATTAAPSFDGLTLGSTGLTNNGTTTLNGNVSVTGTSSVTVGTGGISTSGNLNSTGGETVSGGATITGTTAINTTGTASTSLGNATGTFSLNSSALKVSTGGAISGVTTLTLSGVISGATTGNTINGLIINNGALSGITGYQQTSGNFSQGGAGTFDTASGQVNLNGNTSVTGSNTFGVGSGGITDTGALNVSGTGTFSSQLNAGSANQFQVNSSGNVISGTINGQTISSTASFTGSVAVQGAAGLTLGVSSSTNGNLTFANATSGKTVSLQALNPSYAGNVSIVIPSASVANDEVCLKNTGNCAGSGGSLAGTGTQNYVARFDTPAGNHLAIGQLYDNGSFVGVNTTTSNGQLSVVAAGTNSAAYIQGAATGSAAAAIIKSGGSTADLLDFQTSSSTTPIASVDASGNASFVGLNLAGNFAQSGAGTFTTGTGSVNLNGNTSVTGSNSFSTGSGSVTLGSVGSGLVTSSNGTLTGGAVDRNSSSYFTNTLTVANGGTGLASLTTNSILVATGPTTYGQLTGSAGQLILSNAAGAPTFTTLGGDATLSSAGALTVSKLQGNTLTITSPTNGQYLRYNGSAFVNSALQAADISGTLFSLAASTGTTQNITSGQTVSILAGASNNLTTTASATGTVSVDIISNPSFTGTVTSNTGFAAGVAGTTQGTLKLATTGTGSVTLQANAQANATLNIPTITGTDTVCLLSAANCAGAGGGVTTSTGTANYVARFTGSTTLGIGKLYDNGTSVGINNTTPAATNLLSINSLVTAASGAQVAVATGAASNVGLVVQGFGTNSTPNQTADLAQFQSSTGTVLAEIDANGNVTTTGNLSAVNGTFSGVVTTTGTTTTSGGLVNPGSTLNTALSLGNFATGGSIGTATNTVDTHTSITIAQTTAGQTLTLPSPTNTTAGRTLYISNVGTASFTIGTTVFNPGSSASYLWNGSAWSTGSIDTGVTQVGTIDSQTKSANGSVIVGNTVYNQSADASFPGLVTTGVQTLAGAKTLTGALTVSPTTGVALTVQGVSGQNIATFKASGGSTAAIIDQFGGGGFSSSVGIGTTNSSLARLTVLNGNATSVGAIIQGAASQTADLLQLQNNTGTVLAKIDATGNISTTGTLAVTGATTLSGTLTTNGGLTNPGSTLNTALALGNFATGGPIGTAVATVDTHSAFTITQTTTSQTLTIPTPTVTTAGRVIYISNTGTTPFMLLTSNLAVNATATLVWNGTAWTFGGADGASILNGTTQQTGANFNIAATSGVAAVIQGAATGDIADFNTNGGVTKLSISANGNLVASASASVTTSGSGATGSGFTASETNTNTSASTSTLDTIRVISAGTANANTGANIINGVRLTNVTPVTNNTFNGIYAGTGYNSILNYNGTSLIDGSGLLQNATFNPTTNYSNLQNVTNLTASGAVVTTGLTNNGSTLNNTLSLTDFATGGTIGTAAATVDAYTSIAINQTTAGQTLTIPSPTNTTAGRVVYISNTGSTSFLLIAARLNPGSAATLIWNGTAWTQASGSAIANQSASTQTANFNIQSAATNSVTARISGASGQSANLLDVVGTNTTLSVLSSGAVQIGSQINNSVLSVTPTGASNQALSVRGFAGQTADLVDLVNSNNNVLSKFDANGALTTYGTSTQHLGIYSPAASSASSAGTFYYAVAATNGTITAIPGTSVGPLVNTATITWAQALGATGYNIYRSTTNSFVSGSSVTLVGSVAGNVLTFTDAANTGSAVTLANPVGNTLTVKPSINQSANVLEVYNASGGLSTFINGSGRLFANSSLSVQTSSTGASAVIGTGNSANIGEIIQASAGQTADLFQLQNVGTVASFSASGQLTTTGLVNNASTLNNTLSLTDFPTGGAIGTAATTVDIYTSIAISQTTANQTLTIPSPTNTTAGRVVYISNTGTASFILISARLNPGAAATLIWNGTAWTQASGSAIANQSATTQSANFNIQSPNSTVSTAVIQGATNATTPTLVLKDGTGADPVSGYLVNYQSATGTLLGGVDTLGALTTPLLRSVNGNGATLTTNLNSGSIAIFANGAANKVLTVRGSSGQTADLQDFLDANSNVLSKFDANGALTTYGTSTNHLGLAAPVITSPSSTGTSFYYVVTATNAAGETVASNVLALAASTSTINWTAVPGATGYKVYRNTSNSFTSGSLLATTITNGATVTFTDSGAATTAGFPPSSVTGNTVNIQGSSAQTADILDVKAANGTNLLSVSSAGTSTQIRTAANIIAAQFGVGANGNASIGYNVGVNSSTLHLGNVGTGSTNILHVDASQSTLSTVIGAVIQASSIQTGDQLQFQSSTGTVLANVTAAGDYNTNGYYRQNGQIVVNTTIGTNNAFFGQLAGNTTTTGSNNSATGYYALASNTTGINNSATGYSALQSNTAGYNNTANGVNALASSVGNNNTALGVSTLKVNTTGNNNTAVGYYASNADQTNTAFATIGTIQNATAIGAYAQVQASNSLVLGSVDQLTKVGIGTTVPLNTFSVSPVDLNSTTITASQSNGSGTITASAAIFSTANVGEQFIYADGTSETITAFTSSTVVTGSRTDITESNKNFRTHRIGLQVTTAANVGVGTASPAYALDVVGDHNSTGYYRQNGVIIANTITGSQNAFFGQLTGNITATGSQNTAVGYQTLNGLTSGYGNAAFGQSALSADTSGAYNTAVGQAALAANTTGNFNVAYGQSALQSNVSGASNAAFGQASLNANTTGANNTGVGNNTLQYNLTGANNTAIGQGALNSNTASFNTAIGQGSLTANSSGNSNTVLGYQAFNTNTGGSQNTALGSNTSVASNSLTNATAIGALASVSASNSIVLGQISGTNGSSVSTKVGIGTTAPTASLQVVGINSGSNATGGFNATDVLSVTGGKGGATTGTGFTAGVGSVISLIGGAGGDAPSGSTNGNGGAVSIQGGAPGAGAGAAGFNGALNLQSTGGITNIGGNVAINGGLINFNSTGVVQSSGTNFLSIDTGGAATLFLGNSNATQVFLATNNLVHTINIGNGGTTAAQTINIGSTGSTSSTTIQSGTGNIALNTNGSTNGVNIKSLTNSTNAFQVQNSAGTSQVRVDTVGGFTYVNGDTNGYNTTSGNQATLNVGQNTTSGRSINVSGTVNLAGSDYAEFIPYTTATKPAIGSIINYNGSNYIVSDPMHAGIVGNDANSFSKSVLAVFLGQVKVQVTGPVSVGDILVANGDATAKAVSPSKASIGQLLSKIAIAQEAATGAGVNLVQASVGTSSDSIATALQSQSSTFQDVSVLGTASINDLNVSGATTLNKLQVMGSADIAANLNIGGDLAVKGNATIGGNLGITGNLTVTGLTSVQDISVAGHIITAGTAPTFQALTAAGTGATVSVDGNDTSGTITVTTGTTTTTTDAQGHATVTGTSPVAGDQLSLTFNKAYGKTPHIILTPNDGKSAPLIVYPSAQSTTSFTLSLTGVPAASTSYTFNYFITQ